MITTKGNSPIKISLIYASLSTLILVLALIPLLQFKLIPVALLIVIPGLTFISVLAVALISHYKKYQEDFETGQYLQEKKFNMKTLILIYTGLSFISVIGVITWLGVGGSVEITRMPMLITGGLFVSLGPMAFQQSRRGKTLVKINEQISFFLSDIAQNLKAGLNLSQSIQRCTSSDYGPLNYYVGQLCRQLSFDIDLVEAMRRFSKDIDSPLIFRSMELVINGIRSGGDLAGIVEAAARDALDINRMDAGRRTSLGTNKIILYTITVISTSILAIMLNQFVPQLEAAVDSISELGSGGPLNVGEFDSAQIFVAYFAVGASQAIGTGIVIGALLDNKYAAGLSHALILIVAVWGILQGAYVPSA